MHVPVQRVEQTTPSGQSNRHDDEDKNKNGNVPGFVHRVYPFERLIADHQRR